MIQKIDTSVSIAGIRLKNPVLVASGTFGYGDEIRDLVPLQKLGGIITKTITLEPRSGNPPPRLAETTGGMLNSIGLQNVGVDRFIEEKWDALSGVGVPLIASVAGRTAEDYLGVIKRIRGLKGLAGIELNLSCPNLQKKIVCRDADLMRAIISKAARASRCPLIAKLSPHVEDLAAVSLAAEKAGADALSLVNTFPGMAIDIRTWKPKLAVITGGLSGPAIKPLALRCVWEVYGRTKLPIIGGGGITTAEDAVEFMLAGAAAVSIGTANFLDPRAPVTVAEGIGEYLRHRGLKRATDLVGKVKTS